MKQLIVRSSVFFGLLAALTIGAFAQSSSAVRVHVPFQFVLGRTMMPAGDYVVEQDSTSGIVYFQSRAAHGSVAMLSINNGAALSGRSPRLVFQREGANVVLTKIQLPDASASFPHSGLISSASR
jgi:hypothetical protein